VFFNTDDTGVFNKSISQEYINMAQAFNLKAEDIEKILLNSANCVFDES
jgi:adenosine deaminase